MESAPPVNPPADPVAINYSKQVGWSGAVTVELIRGGTSTLIMTFNDDGKPEIGMWQGSLPDEAFALVLSKMREANYRTLAGPRVLVPGARRVGIGERAAGEQMPSVRAFEQDVPALKGIEEAVEAAMNQLRAHPLRVLQGKASLAQTRLVRGAPFAFTVSLTNVGTEPLDLPIPRVKSPAAGVAFGWPSATAARTNGR